MSKEKQDFLFVMNRDVKENKLGAEGHQAPLFDCGVDWSEFWNHTPQMVIRGIDDCYKLLAQRPSRLAVCGLFATACSKSVYRSEKFTACVPMRREEHQLEREGCEGQTILTYFSAPLSLLFLAPKKNEAEAEASKSNVQDSTICDAFISIGLRKPGANFFCFFAGLQTGQTDLVSV